MAIGEKNGWKSTEYRLKGESIEEIAARIEGYLRDIRTERTDILRIRFSLEEALLRWRDHFGEDARVRIGTGIRLGRPMITMELPGDNYDPLTSAENDLDGKISVSDYIKSVDKELKVKSFYRLILGA